MNNTFFGFNPDPKRALVSRQPNTVSDNNVEIDPGVVQLFKRRIAVNVEDDHFNQGFLRADWIPYASPAYSLTTLPGWIEIMTASAGILLPVPSGDWTIETEHMSKGFSTVGGSTHGLLLSTSTNSASMTGAFYLYYRDGAATYGIQFQKLVNNAFNAQYTGSPVSAGIHSLKDHIFMRIDKTGTTYTCFWSDEGNQFYRHIQTAALTFTPAYFGIIGIGFYNYFLRVR